MSLQSVPTSTRPPTKDEILPFLQHLGEEKLMVSSTTWSMYSMVISVSKGKYSLNLKQYCRVTALLNSSDTDIKKKANIFSTYL